METPARCAAGIDAFAAPAHAGSVVTIYAADGLHDGKGSWFENEFAAFTKATGVEVRYVEAGRAASSASPRKNPTRRPTCSSRCRRSSSAPRPRLLQKFKPEAASAIDGGDDSYQPLVNNFQNFIYDGAVLKAAPATYAICSPPASRASCNIRRPARPATAPPSCCR